MAILKAFPEADLSLTVIWTDVFAVDDTTRARRAAMIFDDPRVRQFHDDERLAGRLFAGHVEMPSLEAVDRAAGRDTTQVPGGFHPDWYRGEPSLFDTVLLFAPEVSWGEEPPPATHRVTALDPTMFPGLDPALFFWGEDMEKELTRLTRGELRLGRDQGEDGEDPGEGPDPAGSEDAAGG